jgi:threonine dehydrogenase-like Zn-dependent dehydrogenase
MFDTWETMLRLLRSDRIDLIPKLDKLLSPKIYPLDDYNEAFELLANGKEMKLIFSPTPMQ